MWTVAANFRRTHSPSRLACSEGWRPPGAQSTFYQIKRVNSHNDFGNDGSTLNIVVVIVIIIFYCIIIIIIIIIR